MSLSFNNTEIAFRAKSDEALRRSHWLFKAIERPWLVKMGTPLVKVALKLRLPVDPLIESTIFRQFCGGESIEESARTIEELGRFGIGSILDYSVEGLGNDASFDETMQEVLRTIDLASRDKHVPFCVFKMTGIARFELMAKIQAKDALSDPEKFEWKRAQDRLAKICGASHEKNVRVFIDAEESWIQDVIDTEARL